MEISDKEPNTDPVYICDFCNEESNSIGNTIYQLVVITDKFTHQYGLKILLEDLNDFLFKKGIHLSASQVVLLRPDILKDFLMSRFPQEQIDDFVLDESFICSSCFEDWKKEIPLK